jgi:hypothetical protein
VPRRLVAGQRTLDPLTVVRIDPGQPVDMAGGDVPEWFRERSAKPRTRVRFPSSPPHPPNDDDAAGVMLNQPERRFATCDAELLHGSSHTRRFCSTSCRVKDWDRRNRPPSPIRGSRGCTRRRVRSITASKRLAAAGRPTRQRGLVRAVMPAGAPGAGRGRGLRADGGLLAAGTVEQAGIAAASRLSSMPMLRRRPGTRGSLRSTRVTGQARMEVPSHGVDDRSE